MFFWDKKTKKWVLSKNSLRIASGRLVKILISKKAYKPQIHPRAHFTHTGDLTLSLHTSRPKCRVRSHLTLGGGSFFHVRRFLRSRSSFCAKEKQLILFKQRKQYAFCLRDLILILDHNKMYSITCTKYYIVKYYILK